MVGARRSDAVMGLHAVENVAAASSRSRTGGGKLCHRRPLQHRTSDRRRPLRAGEFMGIRCKNPDPRVAHAERRCAGVGSLTQGNLAARHADCARLIDESGKKGWQKLDGPQRGQVHPGLIWQDAVRARPSSRERTWPLSFLGCRIADGPCRSQSRLDGKMGVKWLKKGAKRSIP
jgi:hypothetical protein